MVEGHIRRAIIVDDAEVIPERVAGLLLPQRLHRNRELLLHGLAYKLPEGHFLFPGPPHRALLEIGRHHNRGPVRHNYAYIIA
jgi:hypothetical protein